LSDLVTVTESGLYCAMGDFYIDPWRSVKLALVTHGHSDHARVGSQRYITHKDGQAILRYRLGEIDVTGVDYGQVLQLGGVKVSFHPAGHVLGSAQIRIESDKGEVWVVSGDYKAQYDPTCPGIEPVRCDTFITESTFGLPIYRFNEGDTVACEIVDWWEKCKAKGQVAMVGAYSLGKAQRLLASLPDLAGPIYVHGSVAAINSIYQGAGVTLPAWTHLTSEHKADKLAKEGALLVAPPSSIEGPWARRFAKRQEAFASGWMLVRGRRRMRSIDRGFVLSDHADWPGLISVIAATGAERVLVTHGFSDPLVRYLSERGLNAATLRTAYGDEEAPEAAPEATSDPAIEVASESANLHADGAI